MLSLLLDTVLLATVLLANNPALPGEAPPESRPPRSRRDGRGMLIAAGVLTVPALVLSSVRAGLMCPRPHDFHYESGCFGGGNPIMWTAMTGAPALGINALAIGLAIGGGVRRGRVDARRGPAPRRLLVAGAATLAFGIAAQITFAALGIHVMRADPVDLDDEGRGESALATYQAAAVGGQLAAMVSTTGAGLLSYTIARRRASTPAQIGVSPTGFSMRF
jgi:hypothetical protein